MLNLIKRSEKNNIFGLDVLRGIAIVLMVITHSFRVFFTGPVNSESFSFLLLQFFMVVEPFTSALFLFLVGIGIEISHSNATKDNKKNFLPWCLKILNKSIILYFIGILMFFVYRGPQVSHMIFSPKILSAIAVSMMALALSMKHKRGLEVSSVLMVLISFLLRNDSTVGLSSGEGSIFPLILFSFFGAIVYRYHKRNNNLIIYLISAVSILAWIYPYNLLIDPMVGWTRTVDTTFKYWGPIPFWGFWKAAEVYKATQFWVHTNLAVLRMLVILVGLYFWSHRKLLNLNPLYRFLKLIGTHSLGCYILHLAIIAPFSLLNMPEDPVFCWVFILALTAVLGLYSHLRTKKII